MKSFLLHAIMLCVFPSAKAFELGGYETWYGEHSYLTARAGEIIEKESLDILKQLENQEWKGECSNEKYIDFGCGAGSGHRTRVRWGW